MTRAESLFTLAALGFFWGCLVALAWQLSAFVQDILTTARVALAGIV